MSVYANTPGAIATAATTGYTIPAGNTNGVYAVGSNTNVPMGAYAATLGTTASPTQFALDVSAYFASFFSVPNAPTGVTASSGNGQATVSFSAPASALTITAYTATCGGFSTAGGSSPITVTGLSNGTLYTCTVTATSNAGTGAASAGASVTPSTVPGAPTIGTAIGGNAQATVSFSAPASNGGAAITSYRATSSPGGFTATAASSPITVSGLTNGTAYTFTVTATNIKGTGSASAASNSVTPATVPGAPVINSVTAGNAQATVNFTPPASNGGAAITSYTVTSSPGGLTASGAGSPITITGLTNGTAYTFTVTANTSAGSTASSPSNSVTPATVPGAPTSVTATLGNGQATVSFSPPASNGGAAITGYTATSSPGGFTAAGVSSPLTVTGLSNGTAYSFTVTATNSKGTGAASAASNSVTPEAPPTAAASSASVAYNSVANIITPAISGVTNPAGITVTVAALHGTATASAVDNTIIYTPSAGYYGADSFSYTVTGPGGVSSAAVISITVNPLPPATADATMPVALNTPTTLDLAASITGSGITGVNITIAAQHGTTTVNGTNVTYTPHKDYFGTDTFTYLAYGTAGVSPTAATVTVIITGRPDPINDARVTGLVNIETAVVKRFGKAQVFNFQQRLESRHHAVYSSPIGSLPGGSGNTPVAAGGASGDRPRGYFNSWQPGTVVAYTNDPVTLLNAPDRSENLYGENTPLSSMLANVVTGALTSSSLNLGAISNAVGAAQEETEDRVEIWAAGNLRFGTRSQSGVDTRFSTDGVSIGADKRMDRKLTLGVGMGYARDKSSIGSDGTNSKASGNSLAGYASYQSDSGTFIDGLLGYGKVTFDTNRYVAAVNDFARASRKGDQIFGSLSFGYEYRNAGLLWSPYGRYDFSYDRLNEGTESGAGANALSYASQTASNSQLAIGMRAQSVHQASFGVVQPSARIEYQRGIETSGQTSIAYADLLGTQYTVAATSQNTNSFVLGLGSEFLLSDTLRFAFDYQRLRSGGRENYQSFNFRLTKDLKGKNDLESLLLESYSSSVNRPTGLVVAAGFAYDDNVSRASAALDKLSDSIYSFTLNKAKSFETSEYTKLTVSGFLDIEKFRTYAGLGHVSAGMQGEYKYRTSGEFGAPTFGVFGRYSADEYESRLRDDVFDSPWFYDYRMKGQTVLWTLGYNLSFGNKDSVDLSWRRVESKPDKTPAFAAPSIRYIDNQYSITYLMAF